MKFILITILLALTYNVSAQCATPETIFFEDFEGGSPIPGAIIANIYGGGSHNDLNYVISGANHGWFNVVNGVGDVYVYVYVYVRQINGFCTDSMVNVSFWTRETYGSTNVTFSIIDDLGVVLATSTLILNGTYQQINFAFTATTPGLRFVIHTNSTGGSGIDIIVEDILITQCNNGVTEDLAYCSISISISTDLYSLYTNIPPGGTWMGPSVLSNGSLGTFDPVLNTGGVYTYIHPATCVVLSSTVTVTNQITPIFDVVTPICNGEALTALPTSSTNATAITGVWSPLLDNTTTTVYTFTPDAGQCAATNNLTITVNPSITPTFNAIADVCQNDANPTLETTSLNGFTGTWTPAISTVILGTTTYTFTPTVGQCATTTTLNVFVTTPLIPTFNPITDVCQNDANPTLETISLNGFTGTWGPAISTATLGTTTYTFTPTAGQCTTNTTLDVFVATPVTPTFDPITDICQNEPSPTLEATSLNGFAGTWGPAVSTATLGTTTYTFTPNTGQCATITTLDLLVTTPLIPTFNALAEVCQNDPSPTLESTSLNGFIGTWAPAISTEILGTTTYTFTPDAGQCAVVTTLTITVKPLSDATITPVGPFCSYDTLILLQAVQPGGVWSGTGVDPVTGEFNPSLAIPGLNDITYTITGLCGDISTIQIEVIPAPVVTTIENTTIISGSSVNLVTQGTGGNYYWTPAETLICDDCQNTIATPDETTTYTVTLEENGCSSSDEVTITIEYESIIFVPNIFSPNSDGANDILFVRGQGILNLTFQVYDRWGEMVFESTALDQGWNGLLRGQPMNPAVFMYVVNVNFTNSTSQVIKGDVTLVR